MYSRIKEIRPVLIVLVLCAFGLTAPRLLVSGQTGNSTTPPGAVFTVTATSDGGPGSLRHAIEQANATPNNGGSPDRIVFEIPGDGPHTIALQSALPWITDPVTIDGYSQPGASANTLDSGSDAVVMIELDGSAAAASDGLVLSAGETTIRGLAIRGFSGDGIRIAGGRGNRIQGNLIGAALSTDAPAGNGGHGVAILVSSGNLIGGAALAERNEIYGSGRSGVLVSGKASVGNSILGNRIRGNTEAGIDLEGDAVLDAGDADAGPNEQQNAPALTRVVRLSGKSDDPTGATIEGTLESAPDTDYELQFFATRVAQGENPRQGDLILGTTQVTTGSTGTGSFLVVLPRGVRSGALITATATDPAGNSSEFSDPVASPRVVRSWLAAVSGNWDDATKWSGGAVPGSGEDAEITMAGTYTVTFNASATVNSLTVGGATGTQTFTFNANTLTLDAASSFGGNAILSHGGGIIAGAGSLTVNGTWNWSAGTLNGTGTTTANGPLNISGGFTKDINGARTLNTPSTVTWTGTGNLRLGSGAVINNTGTWDCQSTNFVTDFLGGTTLFTNSGTYKKTTAAGTTTLDLPFNNTGSVQAQIGTIAMRDGGTHTGNFDATGGTVQFSGGTHDLNAGTSLIGSYHLLAGVLSVNSPLTAASFDQTGGTLQGAGTFTVTGLYAWSAGVITGAGIVNANGGMTLSGTSPKDITGARTLNTSNTVAWTGTGQVRLGTGAAINNTGTWDCQSTSSITDTLGGTTLFTNSGVFKKTTAAGTTTLTLPFNNTGSVQAQIGTIILGDSGTHTGSFDGTGGAVGFQLGTHDLNAGTSFTGTFQLLLGGVLNINTALTAQTFTQSGGTLQGPAAFTVSGLYTWSAGTITGAGIVNANGGMSLSTTSAKDLTIRTLNSPATTTWTSTGAFRMGNGAVVNNSGTWDSQSDASITNPFGGGATFTNSGTFKKSGGTGTTLVQVALNNTGTVLAQTGTITLPLGGTHTGNFDGAGGTVLFNGGAHDLNAGTSFNGTVQQSGGILNVNSALTAQTFTQSAGVLQGPATFTINGPFNWSSGFITGAGVINVNGGMTLSGVLSKEMAGTRTLNTSNTVTWTGTGSLRLGTGAAINNTGTWDSQSDAAIVNVGSAGTFANSGTFRKSAGTGTTTVPIPFTTSGTVEVQIGTLNVNSSNYTQTAGITRLTGGALTSTTTNINIQGGSLSGSGTVTGRVIVSGMGALAPGLSAGTLSLVGDYVQQAPNGVFNVEIGGLTPGTQYDRVDISGGGSDATLAGTLNISLINAFIPNDGDTFTVMTYPVHTGSLTPNFSALTGCRSWNVNAGPTAMVMTAVQVPVEMSGLTYNANKVDLAWAPAPSYPGTTYDVIRGDISTLPVGPGAGETCVASGTSATMASDAAIPAPGQGFWYLVRERVSGCGIGTYGFASAGGERLSTGCP